MIFNHLLSFIMTYLVIIFFIIFFSILILIVGWSIKNGIGPMPTSPKVKRLLLDHLPKHCKGIIFELGSGWGTLAFSLAKKYPDCSIMAYENSPVPYGFSKFLNLFFRHRNLSIKRQDFFDVNLEKGTIIICYLYPEAMKKLKEKFEKELKPGTLIASHTFSIRGWSAVKIIEVPDIYHSKIYFYVR